MRRHRFAKIVATLGPATSTFEKIEQLFLAGADNFRFNFSHGSHDDHQMRYDMVRAVEEKYNRPLGVIADLQGPKLRIGVFQDTEIILKSGDHFQFDLNPEPGSSERVYLPHPEIFQALTPGSDVLVDDGRVHLKIVSSTKETALGQVITGGAVSNRKGVNVPHVHLPISSLTEKDHIDLQFALKMGADWIALSFVQKPEDVQELRKLLRGRVGIISKLEKPMAIDHLEEIVSCSDAIMVARGDLGVEMAAEKVPGIQKRIISACRQAGCPVIVATQMLDSMVHAPVPTRAETSDVATAIYDGADGVMLSAESASGSYPVESVSMMSRIITSVENDPFYGKMLDTFRAEAPATPSDAIAVAVRHVAQQLSSRVIVTLTAGGTTTMRVARERPLASLLSLTPQVSIARRLALIWGAHSVVVDNLVSANEAFEKAADVAQTEGFSALGDDIIVTVGGGHFGEHTSSAVFQTGSTCLLRIVRIGEGEENRC